MVEGQIALGARGIIPETWDALANSTYYGEQLLGMKSNFVKFQLFGTVVDTSQEAVFYNPLVLEYAAMGLAITVIPGAADFYANKIQTITSTGTSESRTYPDRVANLWKTQAALLVRMQELQPQVQEFFPDLGARVLPFLPSNSGSALPSLVRDPAHMQAELGATRAWECNGFGNGFWGSWGFGSD